ncbi:MAG: HlyD family efflux transporter periplasmic adaptor subunit [Muribaculaceae bacterium]|nr:HlyD family efflux transporter periplasmic adaptor subunit [Muribaculaceae bacterium]
MDRELTKKEKLKEKKKIFYKISAGILAFGGLVTGIVFIFENGINEDKLQIATAERATMESSVTASGKVVPLYEQSIVSPVATKILEVYCEEGDSVSMGQSLLRLDLESAEIELRRLSDEVSMKNIELEQTALNNETYLTDLEMKIKTKEMSVNHLKAEVANEKRLDSIGSGTGDKIREAELAYSTALLELEQMKTQLVNERKAHSASYKSKQLEGAISQRNLHEMERTLEDARIKAPKPGIVTFLNKELGTSISAGEKLAVVSDLSHFKITAEIPESKAGLISVGSIVKARFNNNILEGKITSISPQSQNGMIEFNVLLDDDKNKNLRSGLRANLDVIFDVHENVVRIPNAQFFQGPGNYNLFVKVAPDKLERRYVTLGDSNFDYIEVINGIEPGEEVVITDLSEYADKRTITLKRK